MVGGYAPGAPMAILSLRNLPDRSRMPKPFDDKSYPSTLHYGIVNILNARVRIANLHLFQKDYANSIHRRT